MDKINNFIWIKTSGDIDPHCGQQFTYSLVEVAYFDFVNYEISLIISNFENTCVGWVSPNELNDCEKKIFENMLNCDKMFLLKNDKDKFSYSIYSKNKIYECDQILNIMIKDELTNILFQECIY